MSLEKPLAIDLYCGLGGWTDGLLAEGYDVVGFDLEEHAYGDHRYPASLVLQDVRTLHGAQFKDAALIVASPPCQAFSYMAMPWTKAKARIAWHRDPVHPERIVELTALFDACFRIQREASEAAGHRIPLVVENVKGAQPWVGRARWHYGSYYLWGDVPALMPITKQAKRPGHSMSQGAAQWGPHHHTNELIKNYGGLWFNIGSPGQRETNRNPVHEHIKCGGDWFGPGNGQSAMRQHSSKSSKCKAASALIAKIPFELARWIGSVYRPLTGQIFTT